MTLDAIVDGIAAQLREVRTGTRRYCDQHCAVDLPQDGHFGTLLGGDRAHCTGCEHYRRAQALLGVALADAEAVRDGGPVERLDAAIAQLAQAATALLLAREDLSPDLENP